MGSKVVNYWQLLVIYKNLNKLFNFVLYYTLTDENLLRNDTLSNRINLKWQ